MTGSWSDWALGVLAAVTGGSALGVGKHVFGLSGRVTVLETQNEEREKKAEARHAENKARFDRQDDLLLKILEKK